MQLGMFITPFFDNNYMKFYKSCSEVYVQDETNSYGPVTALIRNDGSQALGVQQRSVVLVQCSDY